MHSVYREMYSIVMCSRVNPCPLLHNAIYECACFGVWLRLVVAPKKRDVLYDNSRGVIC